MNSITMEHLDTAGVTMSQRAFEILFPVVKGRFDLDKVAWYSSRDAQDVMKIIPGFVPQSLASVYRRIAKDLGVEYLEDMGRNPKEMLVIREILKMNSGVWDDTAKGMFAERFPEFTISGPMISCARRALGFAEAKHEKEEDDCIDKLLDMKLREPLLMLQHFEKLCLKKAALCEQRDSLDEMIVLVEAEMAQYKPLVHALENIKTATDRIRQEQRMAVSEERIIK